MNKNSQIDRLNVLSQMILDLRMSELRAAVRSRQQSLDQLASLMVTQADDLPPILAAQAALRYEHWAEARRGEINLTLARQTAEWMEKQAIARKAFGQAETLKSLAEKSGRN